MFKYYFVWIFQYMCFVETLISSNKEIMTGNISYVCAFFRAKDYAIDDISMPEILTFCSCTIIKSNWALTAKQCYVQQDWYVASVITPFTNKLPEKLHTIVNIFDTGELTLVHVTPEFEQSPVNLTINTLDHTMTCKLFGFSTPNGKPIIGNSERMLYKVWYMEGDLLRTNVEALYYEDCQHKYLNGLSEYKRRITKSTMCLNAVETEYLEPCSFDRGAPVICNGLLQGVLIYHRPLPPGTPLHLPVGCYGNINSSVSIYAEALTPSYLFWIQFILRFSKVI